MNIESLQPYLLPALVVAFLVWRFFRFKKVKGEIPQLLNQGALVVDVRSPSEFQQGARPGSLNIPLGELETRAKELDKNKTIILCCASGTRSGMALGILKKNGFQHVINAGPWTNTLS
ncbi:MAG: rhodanese-like domain-containing protein [Bacillota bacterium]